jgi:alkylresorcinol/alkylpyrone synthase
LQAIDVGFGRITRTASTADSEASLQDRTGPRIAGLAVSDSPQTYSQDDVLKRLGLVGDEFAERIFARSGVERRHLNLESDYEALSLQGRTALIEEELLGHSIRAIEQLGVDPAEIGTLITATLFSLGVPTLAHRLAEHFGMDPSLDKYHITSVGCASAVPLLRLASQTLRDHPDKPAVVVAAESMSSLLTPATGHDPRAKTVGAAIFGDGCAAALLSLSDGDSTGRPEPRLLASQVHHIAGTLDAVKLEISSEEGYLYLARELPDLATADLRPLVDRFLQANGLEREAIDHWIVHPGGRRVIERVQETLELSPEQVRMSWNALSYHGNVGTPAIMYVLKDMLEQRDPRAGQYGLMVTVGPGITAGLMLLGF